MGKYFGEEKDSAVVKWVTQGEKGYMEMGYVGL